MKDSNISLKQLKQDRNALKKARDLQYVILESIEFGVTVQNKEGRLIYANAAAARLSGYDSSLALINAKPEQLQKKYILFEEDGSKVDFSTLPGRLAFKDGKIHKKVVRFRFFEQAKDKWALVRAIPILDQQNKIEYIVNTFQDVTEQVIEEQRTQHFISIGSHELKTPLAGIKVLNQLLEKQFRDKRYENIFSFTAQIDRRINELTKIINDFLDVAKIRVGKLDFVPDFFYVDEFMKEIVKDLQTSISTHTIKLKCSAHIEIFADRERLKTSIMNLIRNARKYSPSANTILVEVIAEDKTITFQVTDYGIGISKENQDRIFEPYFRVYDPKIKKTEGLGLGLFIAQKVADIHGGKMGVISKLGKGSTFYITIPVQAQFMKKSLKF